MCTVFIAEAALYREGIVMYGTRKEPRPILPGFEQLYVVLIPLSWLVLRCAAGGILFVHGYAKLAHVEGVVGSMQRAGLSPPTLVAWVVTLTESVGAIGVVLGLFTRFFAAACAIDMAVICFYIEAPHGFGAMQFTLLWGLVFLAIALRGGGPYSFDRLIGREL